MAGPFQGRVLPPGQAMGALAGLPRAPPGVPPLGLGARPAPLPPLQQAKNILDAAGNDKGRRKEALRDASMIMTREVYPVNVVDLAKQIQESIDYVNFSIDEKYEEMKNLIAAEQQGARRRRGKKSRKPRKPRRITRRRRGGVSLFGNSDRAPRPTGKDREGSVAAKLGIGENRVAKQRAELDQEVPPPEAAEPMLESTGAQKRLNSSLKPPVQAVYRDAAALRDVMKANEKGEAPTAGRRRRSKRHTRRR
jgi:hypothetical protein